MKPDAECHRSFRCRQLFPKDKMHATSLPETSRTHVNTHKLDPHSPARLAIYGFLFGPIMIFDGHNFNLQGLRWTKGTPELAMLWPAVPCLACFSQFPPTATEHRLQVGQFLSPADKILSAAAAARRFLSAPFKAWRICNLHAPQRDCEVSWALLLWHTLT